MRGSRHGRQQHEGRLDHHEGGRRGQGQGFCRIFLLLRLLISPGKPWERGQNPIHASLPPSVPPARACAPPYFLIPSLPPCRNKCSQTTGGCLHIMRLLAKTQRPSRGRPWWMSARGRVFWLSGVPRQGRPGCWQWNLRVNEGENEGKLILQC